MTNLDPKHLDALDALVTELPKIGLPVAADAITALRARIDRERASKVVRAVAGYKL